MRVTIDRTREERAVKTGWFSRVHIFAYCIFLSVRLSEEERYLIRHTGIGSYPFFRAPIPPDVTDPEKIKQLKADNYGAFFVRDILGFKEALIGVWPDLIAADNAEAAIRAKLDEIALQLARAAEDTERRSEYEP